SPGSLMLAGGVPNAETSEAIARSVRSYLGKDEELINRLALNTPTQVYLRVRVTEVSRAVTQQLGINWSGIATSGNFFAGVISGNGFGALVNTYSNSSAGTTGAAAGAFGVNR